MAMGFSPELHSCQNGTYFPILKSPYNFSIQKAVDNLTFSGSTMQNRTKLYHESSWDGEVRFEPFKRKLVD